jgi:hypothetical protein
VGSSGLPAAVVNVLSSSIPSGMRQCSSVPRRKPRGEPSGSSGLSPYEIGNRESGIDGAVLSFGLGPSRCLTPSAGPARVGSVSRAAVDPAPEPTPDRIGIGVSA